MAEGFLGANPDQLRDLARQFGASSDQIKSAVDRLNGRINSGQGWKGPDAEIFRSRWNSSLRPSAQTVTDSLNNNAKILLRNADEQEKASAIDSSGPGNPGNPGTSDKNFIGPDWLADKNSPFRKGWDTYGWTKLYPNMRAGIFDTVAMARKGADFLDPDAWKAFKNDNMWSKAFNASSDLVDGKWGSMAGLAEGSKALKMFDGLGKGLGGVGVGLDLLDAANAFSDGNEGQGTYSLVKAALGVGAFMPPPVGTVSMVASGALFLYDNVPAIKDSVNWVGGQVAQAAEVVGGAVVDSAKAVGNALADAGGAVANFFGF